MPFGSDDAEPSNVTGELAETDWSGPAFATGAWATAPSTWSSASPTFTVVVETVFTVNRTLVVRRAVKRTVVALPVLSRAPTATVVPSENVSVPLST